MIKQKLTADKLRNLILSNIKDSLPSTVVKVNKDVYKLFGLYTVNVVDRNTVKVKRQGETVKHFASLKAAISWCSADNYGEAHLARNIAILDNDQQRIKNDIMFSIEQVKQNKANRSVVSLKIDYKKEILSRVTSDLHSCISKAKYIQIKEFDNEIERFRRSAQ